jgi:hypothetical protein
VTVWISNVVSLDFVFTTAREIKFEMSFEMKTGTAESCRKGKILKEM